MFVNKVRKPIHLGKNTKLVHCFDIIQNIIRFAFIRILDANEEGKIDKHNLLCQIGKADSLSENTVKRPYWRFGILNSKVLEIIRTFSIENTKQLTFTCFCKV